MIRIKERTNKLETRYSSPRQPNWNFKKEKNYRKKKDNYFITGIP